VESIIFVLITTKMSEVSYSSYRTDNGKLSNRNHSWVKTGDSKFWTKQWLFRGDNLATSVTV